MRKRPHPSNMEYAFFPQYSSAAATTSVSPVVLKDIPFC